MFVSRATHAAVCRERDRLAALNDVLTKLLDKTLTPAATVVEPDLPPAPPEPPLADVVQQAILDRARPNSAEYRRLMTWARAQGHAGRQPSAIAEIILNGE